MNHRINLQNTCQADIDAQRLRLAAEAVLEQHPAFRGDCLSIVVASDDAVRELNWQHRKVNDATDVLSFPATPLPDEIDSSSRYLGDVLVAHDYVSARAASQGADIADTLCLLVIHGTLHLLGYDHDTPAARARMWDAQERALRALEIDPSIVSLYGETVHD